MKLNALSLASLCLVLLSNFIMPKSSIALVQPKLLKTKTANLNLQDDRGNTALHNAVYANDIKRAIKLIEEGANPSIKDKQGQTIIHIAAFNGNYELISYLLSNDKYSKSLNFDAKNEDSSTPLLLAAQEDNLKTFKLLLDNGASPHTVNKYKQSAIFWSALNGNYEMADMLFQNKVNPEIKEESGFKALFWTIISGDPKLVQLFLDNGCKLDGAEIKDYKKRFASIKNNRELATSLIEVKLNSKDKHGKTPIHRNIGLGSNKHLNNLITIGADLNIRDGQGLTPLQLASKQNNYEIVQTLIENKADLEHKSLQGDTALVYAIKNKVDPDIITLLVHSGANTKVKDKYQNNIFTIILDSHNLEALRILTDAGVKFNKRQDSKANTPLHLSTYACDQAVSRFLIEKGADINAQNLDMGSTPLHLAAAYCPSLIPFLIEKGANIEIKNKKGDTPLLTAIVYSQSSSIDTLLQNGANVNSKDNDGYTVLHKAIYHSPLLVEKIINSKSINIQAKEDEEGLTALHFAILMGEPQIAKSLISLGADVNAKDNEGKTAIDYMKEEPEANVELLKMVQ